MNLIHQRPMRWLLILFLLISPSTIGESLNTNADLYIYIKEAVPIRHFEALELYKMILGKWESNNIDTITNYSGHKGRYQFCKATAESLGVSYDSLYIKKWSDIALVRLMRENWTLLGSHTTYKKGKLVKSKNYHKYVGKVVGNIRITEAGLLAAAHLKGWSYVTIFLDSNGTLDGRDGNGMHVSTYIEMMKDVYLKEY